MEDELDVPYIVRFRISPARYGEAADITGSLKQARRGG
jgi:hypothetical protein